MLRRNKKNYSPFEAAKELDKIARCYPCAGILYANFNNKKRKVGRVTFVWKINSLLRNGVKFYVIPNKQSWLKNTKMLNKQNVSLRFFCNRNIFYSIDCKVVDHAYLPTNSKYSNDLTQNAYSLVPIGKLTKLDRRKPVRYFTDIQKSIIEGMIPYINFDFYIHKTDASALSGKNLSPYTDQFKILDFYQKNFDKFTIAKANKAIRNIFIQKKIKDRFVYAHKKVGSTNNAEIDPIISNRLDIGRMNLLGTETEMIYENLVLSHSNKTKIFNSIYGNDTNPFKLIPDEIISIDYSHKGEYYTLSTKVINSNSLIQTVQPLELPKRQNGLKLKLTNYSPGGVSVEGNQKLIEQVLSEKCHRELALNHQQPVKLNNKTIQTLLGQSLFHLTLYPIFTFPKSLRRFEPQIPFKICLLGQIVGGCLLNVHDQARFKLNIQFCYEQDSKVNWRNIRDTNGSKHLTEVSGHIRSLMKYIKDYKI